jgi:sugar-specific transcriptional regulator TrmB
MKVIWNGKAVVEMLRDFGLSEYEARMYFVLLTLGEAKVTALTKRAYVPQSKGYDVLDRLVVKGFVELSNTERPKKYSAKTLQKIVSNVISKQERFMKKLSNNFESLQNILHAVSPIYEEYGTFRLFSPNFPRREEAWLRVSSQV